MNKNKRKYDFEEFEKQSQEMISKVLNVCEAELAKRNDNDEALPYVAMSVRESLLAFLALVKQK